MFSILIKSMTRSKGFWIGLTLLFAAGLISILIGRQHLEKQETNAKQAAALQKEQIQRNLHFNGDDLGLMMYYLQFGLVNQPDKLNGLSIGQRDINASLQKVTIRNLESQRYDTDLTNPANQQSGNLDLAFVIIYLFPLVIIALTYNLLSEEKEEGTWRLVSLQGKQAISILLGKLVIRAVAVYMVWALLMVIAVIVLSLSLNVSLLAVVALTFCYLLFWFCLCFWIVSWKQNSHINAVALLALWVGLVIIFPAAVNNYIINRYALPEAQRTAVANRDGYHTKWDIDRKTTMDKFYAHYPQFAKYGVPAEPFSWTWYYAMQQMGDDDAQKESQELMAKLWQRERASKAIAMFIPTLHTQLQFNDLAKAGLANQLLFLDSTAKMHEKLRLHFYPLIFDNRQAKDQDWSVFKVASFSQDNPVRWVPLLLPLLILVITLVVLTCLNMKHRIT